MTANKRPRLQNKNKSELPVKESDVAENVETAIQEIASNRPPIQYLPTLDKAMYHNYKMHFTEDKTGKSSILYNGVPVVPAHKGGTIDLADLFKSIKRTFGTL